MLMTTLAEIRSHNPCEDGFAKIRDHLGVSAAEAKTHDTPFPVALLLETNDLDDTLWVFDRVAPRNMIDAFLIRRLDEGDHSALKTLHSLDGDWSTQIKAVEAVVALLHRRIAGENVDQEMIAAANAANDAAIAAYAAAAGNDAADAANSAAYAAAHAAVAFRAANATARGAYDAAAAARAVNDVDDAAYADLIHVMGQQI